MGEISKAKLLGTERQMTHQGVDKSVNKTMNKVYAEYKQHELNETAEKTEKVLVNHLSNVHLTAFFQVVKSMMYRMRMIYDHQRSEGYIRFPFIVCFC